MSDEESYGTDGKEMFDETLKKNGEKKPLSAKDLEPFGNEETAEVKYRTMKWWSVTLVLCDSLGMTTLQKLTCC